MEPWSLSKAKELYASGLSLSQVGEMFGLTALQVSRKFKKANFQTRTITEAWEVKAKELGWNLEDATKRYQEGETSAEIAKRYGIGWQTVLIRLRKAGVRTRSSAEARRPISATEVPWDLEVARSLYESKMSIKQISVHFGLDSSVVHRRLVKHKIHEATNNHVLFDEAQELLIVGLYTQGVKISEIAKQHKCSRNPIVRVLERYDIEKKALGADRREYKLNEHVFNEITEQSAYWAGFIMADGCIYSTGVGNPKLQVSLAKSDKQHLEKLRVFLETETPLYESETSVTLCVTSNIIAEALAKFGIVPQKTATAEIKILEHSHHFYRGLIDGDGSLGMYKSHGDYDYPRFSLVGSRQILTQFSDFCKLNEIGHPPVTHHDEDSPKHETQLAGPRVQNLIRLLYKDCAISLDRKQAIADQIISWEPRRVCTASDDIPDHIYQHLSPKQKGIADLRSAGLSWNEIAQQMNLGKRHVQASLYEGIQRAKRKS